MPMPKNSKPSTSSSKRGDKILNKYIPDKENQEKIKKVLDIFDGTITNITWKKEEEQQ